MKKKKFAYIFAFVLVFVLSACGAPQNEDAVLQGYTYVAQAEEDDEPQGPIITPDEFVGFHQFLTFELGVYVDDVLDILGEPDVTSRGHVPGSTSKLWVTGRFLGVRTRSESLTFVNGYAILAASQSENFSNISAEEFNQVSIGMSESEVFEILGVPNTVLIAAEPAGSTTATVIWMNQNPVAGGSVTFTDGLVSTIGSANFN